MKFVVEIAVDLDDWHKHTVGINEILFNSILSKILLRYPNFAIVKSLELSILLTSDATMATLNKEFRGQDKATNVLSFPDMEMNWRQLDEFVPDVNYYLGDIAFGYETLKREAQERSISIYEHFKHLTVHSVLHLLGYDHQTDEDANIMESIEIEILEDLGVKSPY